ncbi:LPP20 family lipoprotein [Psychromonas ossibalaenae]|uniref:LPP20 family lipoprotein n=1 Tax=Psychromonas ossibalaenae TaxID=444922 RepID=UPI00039EEADF|nr:LPP20 family lipoprotein [Psychromonas ossibalaenae]
MKLLTKNITLFLLFTLLSSQIQAAVLDGEGYGKTQKAAQDDALASLAATIFVRIESSFEQQANNLGEYSISSSTRSSTDLPIIGAEFNCREKDGYYCLATLNSKRALPLYEQKLTPLYKEIRSVDSALKQNNKKHHYRRLKSLLQLLEQSDKYRTLITFLSGKNTAEPQISFSRQQLNEQLLALESQAPSLELAAELLARGIPDSPVYIRPATLRNSREVTPFAGALQMQLQKALPNSAGSYEQAEFSYSGSYQISKQGILVAYSLVDRDGNTISTSAASILPEAYRNYRAEPLAPDFDRLLHKGYALDSDFKVQLATNKGSRQLLFHQGEMVKLMVKLNRPGYFYIVGHAKNNQQELSYLLEAGYGEGSRKFVYFVNGDQINKWLSLGEFETIPPFGIESLQVIAAEKDLIDKLPGYRYDNETGYFKLADNISQGLGKTRGLQKVKSSNTDPEKTAEAVLLFTTQQNLE